MTKSRKVSQVECLETVKYCIEYYLDYKTRSIKFPMLMFIARLRSIRSLEKKD